MFRSLFRWLRISSDLIAVLVLLQLITEKYHQQIRSNCLEWARTVKICLHCQRKLGHIDGTKPKPTKKKRAMLLSAYADWDVEDQMILSSSSLNWEVHSRTPCIIWDFTRSIDWCGQVLSFKPRYCYGIWASARNLWVEERWQKPGWLLFHAMVMGNLRWYHIHVLHWRETKTDRLAAHVQFVKGCSNMRY